MSTLNQTPQRRRLVAVAAVVLVLVAGGCSSTPHHPTPASATPTSQPVTGVAIPVAPTGHADAATTPGTSVPTGSSATTAAAGSADGEPRWDPAVSPSQVAAQATGFVAAWARPDLPGGQWWAGISGFVATSAAAGFRSTDPTMVPATAVTGPAAVVGTATGAQVSVAVPTDAGTQLVTLARSSDQSPWLVTAIAPAAGG